MHVQDSRLRMVDAAEAERRRIERDLHDGAQQRLLALTLTPTRARTHLATDPAGALDPITQAQHASREAMDELGQVTRGLHPKVLTDHGLTWALPVAAERAPLPVHLHLDLDERPSPRAEGVAYYMVCEALTNVAKHARAHQATVRASRIPATGPTPALLRVSVADDGRGGADPDQGTGLYGLWDRLDALDATLDVHTPHEEGTTLTAHIPPGRHERARPQRTRPHQGPRVIIAEDSVLLRQGMALLLQESGVHILDQVGDAQTLLESVAAHPRTDLCLIGIRMPPPTPKKASKPPYASAANTPT